MPSLAPDRYLPADGQAHRLAVELYEAVASLPLICPHGHIDAASFADPSARLDPPGRLFVTDDHYVHRLLFAHGLPPERLGLRPRDGGRFEADDRALWKILCENLHLFAGTPVRLWLIETLAAFEITHPVNAETADRIYDELEERLASPEFRPRALLDRFRIETLATTDPASSTLESHRRLQEQGLAGRVRPTFRPDGVVDIAAPRWRHALRALEQASGIAIDAYDRYIAALSERRSAFSACGATATDHATTAASAAPLDEAEAAAIFARALTGEATQPEARAFEAHMLMEFARMSEADGLVMQLHLGSLRDHDRPFADHFGSDVGADIPIAVDWTRGLRPLLEAHGAKPGFRLILFTLDESTYSRELAPLAGHYPALFLGPPWWFNDSPRGIVRFLDHVTETAGIFKLAGFNDDARALPMIPVRHDLWRRRVCGWLAESVTGGLLDATEAPRLARAFAYELARYAYRLDGENPSGGWLAR